MVMAEVSQIKACFAQQVRAEFENANISPFTQDWERGIELLFELIKFPSEGINLYSGLLDALEQVLIEKPTDYNALSSFTDYFEKYLALIGDFTGKNTAIKKATKKPLALMHLIRGLLLDNQEIDCYHRSHLDKFREQPNFLEHLCRAYCTRNDPNLSLARTPNLSLATTPNLNLEIFNSFIS
jgi:hypothetical protein